MLQYSGFTASSEVCLNVCKPNRNLISNLMLMRSWASSALLFEGLMKLIKA